MKPTLRFLGALLLVSSVAAAKSYSFTNLTHDVYLQRDGSVRIVDNRTYDFNGSYSFAKITIEPKAGGSVRFEQAISTDGKPAPLSSVDGNTLRLDFNASDEQRSFKFAYTLTGDLDVASDVVQFDRQLLTQTHNQIRNYTVRLHAPAGNPEPFRVFIFTGNNRIGTLEFDTPAGLATVKLPTVSESEFVRIRAFMPSAQFPQAQKTVSGNQFAAWLAEISRDTQGFRDASREALNKGGFAPPPPPPPAWLFFVPFISVFFIGGNVLRAYQRYGREPQTEDVGKYYREPAEEIPPSTVPYILAQNNAGTNALGKAVGATLLDFARRGIINLTKQHSSGFLGIGAKDETCFELNKRPELSQLNPFERQLWSVLNSARGGDNLVTPDELRAEFRGNTNLAQVLSAMPRTWYESTHGPLLDSSNAGQTSLWTFGAFFTGAASLFGGFFLLDSLTPLGVGLMVAGVLNILAGVVANLSLSRWNADKLLNAKRWLAYRNFLTDFSAMNQAPAEHLKLWDYHFVYASALGVATAYLSNLKRLAETYPQYYNTPPWIGYYGGYGPGNLGDVGSVSSLADQLASINSLSSIASNLSSLETALNPSSSGSSGGFGGSSFGGGGGGGGDSAG